MFEQYVHHNTLVNHNCITPIGVFDTIVNLKKSQFLRLENAPSAKRTK